MLRNYEISHEFYNTLFSVDPEHQHLYFTIAQGLRHLMAGGGREITDNKIISSIKIEGNYCEITYPM